MPLEPLRRCPFCGNSCIAILPNQQSGDWAGGCCSAHVGDGCFAEGCYAKGPVGQTRAEARKSWNHREEDA